MASNLTKFIQYQRAEGGIYPPTLAAQYLGVSRQGLHYMKRKRWLSTMFCAGQTYYGLNSLRLMKECRTARAQVGKQLDAFPHTPFDVESDVSTLERDSRPAGG